MAASGAGADIPIPSLTEEELELHRKRIKAAFEMFAAQGDEGVLSEDEVPNALRYLGVFASDEQLASEIIEGMHDDAPASFIRYPSFEAKALELLQTGECAPDSEDVLLRAFRTFDPDNTGYVPVDKMKQLLLKDGTAPFREKEFEAFLRVSRDKAKPDMIQYEDYVALLLKQAEGIGGKP